MRIALLTRHDATSCFMDNSAPESLHYYNDTLHTYLQGAANTFEFTCSSEHRNSYMVAIGNKVAFRYRNKDYYLNIVNTEQTEEEIKATCHAGSLELINEVCETFKGESLSFAEYFNAFNTGGTLTLGLNEVSTSRISNEWTGEETLLARLFSLANVFGAEIEFVPVLNKDHSLKTIRLNAYVEHSDVYQGIGHNRTDTVLRIGYNIESVKRSVSIEDLFTAIKPVGKDGLTLAGWKDETITDSKGNPLFVLKKSDGIIYAPQSMEALPSNLATNDRYIVKPYSYETDSREVLFGHALGNLKKYCVPQASYEVKGYIDADLGDTYTIADEYFDPPLYLTARVTEQEISFTEPAKNKTTFDNFVEKKSLLSSTIMKMVEKMQEEKTAYSVSIDSSSGSATLEGGINTVLTARVYRNGTEMTEANLQNLGLKVKWAGSDGTTAEGKSITVVRDRNVKTITFTVTVEDNR